MKSIFLILVTVGSVALGTANHLGKQAFYDLNDVVSRDVIPPNDLALRGPVQWTCSAGAEVDYATARTIAEREALACNPSCIRDCTSRGGYREALVFAKAETKADRNRLYTWRAYCVCQ